MEIEFKDLDKALQEDIAEDYAGFEFHEIALENAAIEGDIHVAYHDGINRAGIVYVGSGSNGMTVWTDASSVGDAVRRYNEDDLIN